MNQEKIVRDFKLTSLSLKNRNTVFLIILVIAVFGMISYRTLPKELFPEVSMPTVFVQTIYPGNPPADIENLISRPIEKEIDGIKGINELRSTSSQDASMIFVEFNSNVDIDKALQDVKDAVDKSKSELPNDLLTDPVVMDLDFSEFPILEINLSGDYSIDELKNYAEYLEDEIETIYEVSKVELKGVAEREIEINVNQHKLDANQLSFFDIENAIKAENISISGGELKMGKMRRSIRTVGEFKNIREIENIIVKNNEGNIVYLRDIAEVKDGYEESRSFARLNKQSVVSIQVIKKSGENLLGATDQVFKILKDSKKTGALPENLKVTITNDQSEQIRSQILNLENSMVMGVIFVVLVLFFFLGLRNALFVGIAIPMSMFLSFAVLGSMGATINMIVLFSLILALGMLVDNAIVVVENIYRFMDQGYTVLQAARQAVGEIALAIISSTATTLAAFFPLVFWDGLIGEFMKYLPITLIIVLTSSLFVALIIIPVLSSVFIKKGTDSKKGSTKKMVIISVVFAGIAIIGYLLGKTALANILMLFAILSVLNHLVLYDAAQWFQNKFLTWFENFYLNLIRSILYKRRPYYILIGTIVLMILTFMFLGVRKPKVVFFPENEPALINVLAEYPLGTDVTTTDSSYKIIENKIFELLKPYNHIVKSVLTTVGEGVKRQNEFSAGNTPNKAMTRVNFIDYEDREGINTSNLMKLLSDSLLNQYSGVQLFIEKEANGPPTGNPINIEISGKDLDKLIVYGNEMLSIIDKAEIEGIENLKMDIDTDKPELLIKIDRDKARRFGLSTMQIAGTIRTALFGKEISDFKVGEDEFPIQLRMAKKYRYDITSLMNQKITFRNNKGRLMQIPIYSVASYDNGDSYGTVKRKNLKRVLTLYSNVIEGYNANEINSELERTLSSYKLPDGYEANFTGEQKEQKKTMAFLTGAMALAISLILIILVSQFNSMVKPFVILASVLFSTIGVFGGIAAFKMDFVIIMTGIGLISLAGVVVNNAIVLIDYIDFLKANKKKEHGYDEESNLPLPQIIECIVEAGKVRLRPVLLTAITTVLGLLPMAVGMNINFGTLLSDFNPQIYFGGDNAAFWGPMSWTVIFGLTFSTFLTLLVVPAMYLIANKAKLGILKLRGRS